MRQFRSPGSVKTLAGYGLLGKGWLSLSGHMFYAVLQDRSTQSYSPKPELG